MASFHADMARADELVRARLRALRLERGLSQEEVAERAGMAASTLSRLESGSRRLALDHLTPLAGALGVEVGDLLAPATRDPRVRERSRTVDGIVIRQLSRHAPGGLVVAHMAFPAGHTTPDPRTHEGHEWLYVISGRLRLVLGDDDLVLVAGEAAEFSTWTPHWMGAVDGPAQALAIFGPQGERVHLRQT
jgi:transcriptional regulator with XRE-family HTH domain